jgi:hypothetical protein
MNKLRLITTLAASAVALVVAAGSAQAATTTYDTLSGWDPAHGGYSAYLEPHYGSTIYGQVITAPLGGRSALTQWAMKIQGRNAMQFRGEVRRWDGDRSIGPALWMSDPRTVNDGDEFVEHQFQPTGVELDPGEQVVLMLTTLRDGSTAGFARLALNGTDPSGYFVRANPQSLADVELDPWIDADQEFDVAYRATFAAPDVDPVPLPERPDPSVGQGSPPPAPVVVATEQPSTQAPPAPAPETAPAPEPQTAPVVPIATPTVQAGASPAQVQAAKRCTVPDLHGKTLRNAKRALKRKGCALGTVKNKGKGKRVAHQGARAGRTLNRGSAVSVSLR